MTTTGVTQAASGTLDAATREQAVQLAVDLCKEAPSKQQEVPDRSQLNTLLRAAQGTPSVQEVLLFVRYQAARQKRQQQGAFLAAVADALERAAWARDIDAVRFFLGSLARAGHVANQRSRQQRGRQGGGGRG